MVGISAVCSCMRECHVCVVHHIVYNGFFINRNYDIIENLITYKQSAQIETSSVLESWADTDIMPD